MQCLSDRLHQGLKTFKTCYLVKRANGQWDFTTPIEEILQTVDHLIAAGKVLYFGFSDTPAWVVAYAIAKAEDYGLPRPVAYQAPDSLLGGALERAELPMARA